MQCTWVFAVAKANLLGQIGRFNTGCRGTAWAAGETGVCAYIACELDCLLPSGGNIF